MIHTLASGIQHAAARIDPNGREPRYIFSVTTANTEDTTFYNEMIDFAIESLSKEFTIISRTADADSLIFEELEKLNKEYPPGDAVRIAFHGEPTFLFMNPGETEDSKILDSNEIGEFAKKYNLDGLLKEGAVCIIEACSSGAAVPDSLQGEYDSNIIESFGDELGVLTVGLSRDGNNYPWYDESIAPHVIQIRDADLYDIMEPPKDRKKNTVRISWGAVPVWYDPQTQQSQKIPQPLKDAPTFSD